MERIDLAIGHKQSTFPDDWRASAAEWNVSRRDANLGVARFGLLHGLDEFDMRLAVLGDEGVEGRHGALVDGLEQRGVVAERRRHRRRAAVALQRHVRVVRRQQAAVTGVAHQLLHSVRLQKPNNQKNTLKEIYL